MNNNETINYDEVISEIEHKTLSKENLVEDDIKVIKLLLDRISKDIQQSTDFYELYAEKASISSTTIKLTTALAKLLQVEYSKKGEENNKKSKKYSAQPLNFRDFNIMKRSINRNNNNGK